MKRLCENRNNLCIIPRVSLSSQLEKNVYFHLFGGFLGFQQKSLDLKFKVLVQRPSHKGPNVPMK
jgi:hypothetical protein